MKTRFLLAAILVLVALPLSRAPAAAVEEGVLDEVRGRVFIESAQGESRPAEEGGYVLSGEIIETGERGFCRVVMPDGSFMEVLSDSRIEFADSRANPSGVGSIILYLGRLWAQIAESQEGNTAFEVQTPTAVAGVRGTLFSMAAGADGAARIGVESGEVMVEGDRGGVLVGAGKETTVEWDKPPPRPSAYQPGEDEWNEWMKSREEALVKNADKIVPWILADVKRSRLALARLRSETKKQAEAWRRYSERTGIKRLTPRQKKAAARQIMRVYAATRRLQRADHRMMARYAVIQRIGKEVQRNPDRYSPEMRQAVDRALRELEEIDVPRIHRSNKVIIDAYVTGLEKAAANMKKSGRIKRRTYQDRRKRMMDARRELGKRP